LARQLHYNEASVGDFATRELAPGSPMNSGKKGTPVLDEATFQKLLAAAYVLQEHHDRSQPAEAAAPRPDNPDSDSDTSILAQIVEIQHEIQTNRLDLEATTNLIAERIVRITGAQGAAIGIMQDGQILYRAARGSLASQLGKTLRPEATLSANTVLHDVILRCTDASADFRVNPEITKRAGISSLISVPVLHGGKTGGALELVFSRKDAFHDQDVRTCQLMAGLVTEALTRTTEEEWRKGLAAERASMLEVLEKIKPQLARLANSPDAALELAKTAGAEAEDTLGPQPCENCGREMGPGELFCGSCGTSRASVSRNDLQSKWATLWNLQKAAQDLPPPPPVTEDPDALIEGLGKPDLRGALTEELSALEESAQPSSPERPTAEMATPDLSLAALLTDQADLAETDAKGPESRVWFRSIAVSPPARQLRNAWQKYSPFVRQHRGDLALGASLLLFLITILWAISAQKPTTSADSGNASATATAAPRKPNRKPAPPKLSFFDQMLVDMGLAEPPPAPSYSGNPDIPVWIDVQSAVYYCPGSDLYGKTPQGRIASQRDAQQDQFEPASRKVCD
jgi:hypothetical protein